MTLTIVATNATAVYAGATPATKIYLGTQQIWTASAPTYTDNFNRPDDPTGLGPDWVNRNGAVGILNHAAYAATAAVWCVATNTAANIGSNDMEVSITIGASLAGTDHSGDYSVALLGCSDAGEGVMAITSPFLAGFGIYTFTDWPLSTANLVTSAAGAWTAGDVLKIGRVGNVYTVYLNGANTGCVWTDAGNVTPRDSGHRITGLGVFNTGNGGLSLDAFSAAGATPPPGTYPSTSLYPSTTLYPTTT